ncbi:MAG: hypothetical protein KC983_00260, partial [Phycisphaerales bacterium]|nr:hypothetical protein [Phycisphaerales bacterium]
MRTQPITLNAAAVSLSLLAARFAVAGGPVNDDCANALPILFEEVVAIDTSAATTDGPPALECFFNNDDIGKDIWYTFTPDTTREYRISMCGSMYDSRLAVYDGCACPAGSTPINCDDDFCDPGLQSEVDVVC